MKNWMIKNKLYFIGAIVGAISGYFYWQQIGCSSGTCAITSKPLNSTLYFAMMGAFALGMFKGKDATTNKVSEKIQKP